MCLTAGVLFLPFSSRFYVCLWDEYLMSVVKGERSQSCPVIFFMLYHYFSCILLNLFIISVFKMSY